jgi:flagellar protein FlaG
VRIVDSQTKEVIRQIPSEEMLAISKYMDQMSGKLIQQKA